MDLNINKLGRYIKITRGLDVSFYPINQVYIETCDELILFKTMNNIEIINMNYKHVTPGGSTAVEVANEIIKLMNKE